MNEDGGINMFTPIETLIETLNACKRYLEVVNNNGEDITIASIPNCDLNVITVKFHGHNGATWDKELWIGDNGELHIETPITRESIFDYREEFGWSKEDVHYIKFGRCKITYLPMELQLKIYKQYLEESNINESETSFEAFVDYSVTYLGECYTKNGNFVG